MSAVEVFEVVAPLLGVLVPFVVAFVVREGASGSAKRWVALVVTLAVSAVSVAGDGWSGWGAALDRFLVVAGEAQVTYAVVSAAVDRWFLPGGLNAVPWFRPGSGVGGSGG